MEYTQTEDVLMYLKSLNKIAKELREIEKERNRIIEKGLLEIANKL